MSKHLLTTIARLKREIAVLETKPWPRRGDYASERIFKRSVTVRRRAISHRWRQIREYEGRLK